MRHPDLADLQAVGLDAAAHDLADRVGQARNGAQALGDALDPRRESRVSRSISASDMPDARPDVDVARVGREDLLGPGQQGVGHGVQRGVLAGPGGQGQFAGGLARPARGRVDLVTEVGRLRWTVGHGGHDDQPTACCRGRALDIWGMDETQLRARAERAAAAARGR